MTARPASRSADVEPDVWGERLDLLTVVRALESLDQPSRVTLVGCTRYVEQGIQYGLAEWRDNGWRWEYFGQMVPVRDADLWQRMDQILQFHRVECGQRRFDAGHNRLARPPLESGQELGGNWVDRIAGSNWLKYCAPAPGRLVRVLDGNGIAVVAKSIRSAGITVWGSGLGLRPLKALIRPDITFSDLCSCMEVRVRTTVSLETIGQLIEGQA